MANNKRLTELEDAIEAKKEDIASGGYDVYSAPWAKQKQQLAELVVEYELMLESERVAAAVREWEELHPPVTEDCPICLGPIRFGFVEQGAGMCSFCLKFTCKNVMTI